jgi:hypothetical protein
VLHAIDWRRFGLWAGFLNGRPNLHPIRLPTQSESLIARLLDVVKKETPALGRGSLILVAGA